MQLNKIKKHTLAAFDNRGAANANEFMSNFKKHLEGTLHVDKATIIGMVSSAHDGQNMMTVYFAYLTPEKKKDKKSNNEKITKDEKEEIISEPGKKKKVKAGT